jgi:hypothetical protein
LKEAHGQTGWLETCGRTVAADATKGALFEGHFQHASGIEMLIRRSPSGYAPLIRAYVSFTLSKLRFHRHHPEFNGLFEYEEYISLKNIDDPNEG